MGATAEYNRKDMSFNELLNVILQSLNDTVEGIEAPWDEVPHDTSPNLAFVAGLVWYSQYGRRLRHSSSAHDNTVQAETIVHNVARIHNHTQGVASDLWEIEHNFGVFKSAVFIFDEDNNAIDAAVFHTDEDNTAITFTSAITGYAMLVA